MRRSLHFILWLGMVQLAHSAEPNAAATLYIEKIERSACAATVRRALSDVDGVTKIDVDVHKKEVIVQFNPAKARAADLAAATAKRGFPATVHTVAGSDKPLR